MACQRVRDIAQWQIPQTIEIRVIRKWISKGKKEELCYQFIDIHGDCIEATADIKDIEHFDSIIRLQSCYRVSNYICTRPRTYMATVEHNASLVIGRRAAFDPLTNSDIPTTYFNFANYELIKKRIRNTALLTDYIGRVEKNYLQSTRTQKQLRKILLQDEMRKKVEVTLWPDMRHLIDDSVLPGDVVAITSTSVSEHNGLLQLESTNLTTVVVNPDMPQMIDRVNRLKALPAMQHTGTYEKIVTIADLKLNSRQNLQSSKNFTCEAKIREIHQDRGWYYVQCSKCSKTLYPLKRSGVFNFVCKDDDDITPNFKYSVNATIIDATDSMEAVFFNDSMQELLNISCEDMVTKHADTTDPKIVPQLLRTAIDTPRLLHLTLKNDGQVIVNNVSEITSATATKSSSATPKTSTFTPATPIPKPGTSKRQAAGSPAEQDRKMKRA